MGTLAGPALYRPILPAFDDLTQEAREWYQRINWRWLLQRAPMLALAIYSSWGVGGFVMQSGKVPLLVGVVGGIAFDLTFLGVIALADQLLDGDRLSQVLYWALNITACGVAALFNTLFYAGGTYAAITPEAITHGAPPAIFGLVYSLFYHGVIHKALGRWAEEERKAAKVREEEEAHERDRRRADELANPYKCEYCGTRKPSAKALNGHKAQCPAKPRQAQQTASTA